MHKLICILLAMLLLCGCGKTEQPENPYRLKTVLHETYRDGEATPWNR